MIKKFDAEKVGRILLQKELDLQEARDSENIWKSLYNDKSAEANKATNEANSYKETFDKLREEVRTMSKYKDAFDAYNKYFNILPEEDKTKMNKLLTKLGL